MFEQRPFEILLTYLAAMAIGSIATVGFRSYVDWKVKQAKKDCNEQKV